jgi:HTH-type transcriptional regulator/antitoxin HigA
MSTLLANPAKMIAKGAPHVIHNDEELEAYTNALFQLTTLENPSRSQLEAIELLTLLVERYEETHYPFLRRTQFRSCDSSSNNRTSHSVI